MKLSIRTWTDRSARHNYLALPWTILIKALGIQFAAGLALPIRWHWNGWDSNSFLFWYHNRDAGVFQARILVVQFGFKKPKKKEVYVA